MTRIIAEIGSTHDGKLANCMKAIGCAAEAGVQDVKFQLLEKEHAKNGNVSICPSWLPELVKYGRSSDVNVFASAWSLQSIVALADSGATSIKFAYSARLEQGLIDTAQTHFKEVIVSSDVMTGPLPGVINLFCIPQYPVYFKVDFAEIFNAGFDGFSDHTLGINQTIDAIRAGARIIEKHVCQCPGSKCPDARFAISWDQVKLLKREAESI